MAQTWGRTVPAAHCREGSPGRGKGSWAAKNKSGVSSSFQTGPRSSSEFQLQKMSNADQ